MSPGLGIGPGNAWRNVFTGRGRLDAAIAGSAGLNEIGTSSFGGSSGGLNVFYLDPADGPSCRLEGLCITNAVAPGVNLEIELAPVTGPAGAAATVSVTDGVVTPGSNVTFATPAATSQLRSVVGFACPAAGFYVLRYRVQTGGMAASSAAVLRGTLKQR